MQIGFSVYGDKQLSASLSRYNKSVSNFIPIWKDLQQDFYQIQEAQFKTEGARGERGSWKRLSPKYEKWKRKVYPTGTILVASGELKDSLTDENHEDAIKRINETSMELGTRNKLGQIHYDGSTKKNLPARKTIDLAPKDKTRWMKMIHQFISKAIGK